MGRKSGAKSKEKKEKKQKRKEESARLTASLQKVADANAVEDPLAPFVAFKKYDRSGLCVTLETKRVEDCDRDTVDWAFNLTKQNMQTLYEQSDWGWNDRDKREEMTDGRAWYLVARDDEGKPVAFVHFRFDMEEDEEVLYCYEIQLEKAVRRKGLGKFMMQILELMAHRYGMLKVMLTTFKHNPEGQDFFRKKLKYEVDDINPEASLYEEEFSYLILSKVIPQKAAAKVNSSGSVATAVSNATSTSNGSTGNPENSSS